MSNCLVAQVTQGCHNGVTPVSIHYIYGKDVAGLTVLNTVITDAAGTVVAGADATNTIVGLCPISTNYIRSQASVTTNTLPASAANINTSHWAVDVSNMSADLDITGWSPAGLIVGAVVAVRKVDASPFRIIFNDGVVTYSFVNKSGEYITLIWGGTSFHI